MFNLFKYYSLNKKVIVCLIITGILSVSNHSYSQLPARFNRKTNFKIEKRDSLYGVLDSNGRVLIPFEYQSLVSGWNDDNFIVKKNGLYGIVNIDNCVLLPITYYSYDRTPKSNPYFKLYKNNTINVYNCFGKIINSEPYDQIELVEGDNFIVRKNKKQFIIDTLGNIISKFYSDIRPITKNKYIVIAYNDTTKYVFNYDPSYRYIDVFRHRYFHEYIFIKEESERFGLINSKGEELLPTKYNFLDLKGNLLLAVLTKKGKNYFGFIDFSGKTILPIIYDSITSIYNNTFVAKRNNKFSIFDSKCNPHFRTSFDSLFFQYGDLVVVNGGKYGMISSKGILMIPLKYDYIGWQDHGIVNAKLKNRMGFIDLKGNIKISFEYEFCSPFQFGYARVGLNNKIGFLDTSGKIVIPIIYDATSNLYEGGNFDLKSYFRIKVKLGNRIFWINERNQYIEEVKDE